MRQLLRTGLKATAAAVPASSLSSGFGAGFRSKMQAELSLACRNVAAMFSVVRHFSADTVVDTSDDSAKPKTPQEEAKRDYIAQVLYMNFVQLSSLNDGVHNSGARQEAVSEYYQNYLRFEESLLGDETKEPFSTLDDGTKIFIKVAERGVAMIARCGHKVMGRMFIGNELTGEKHLSILSSLAPHELAAVGVKKAPEIIISEMLAKYRSHLEKTGEFDAAISKQIKISCIGDYRSAVYAITDGQPGVLREDESLKRQIPLRSLLDGAAEILAGKEIKPMPIVAARDLSLGLNEEASNLFASREEAPWR